MNIITHTTREAWLETRRNGADYNYAITATDAAVILGEHPQKSRVQLYYEKRGEIDSDISPELRENLDNRRDMEAGLDVMYRRTHPGWEVDNLGEFAICQNECYPWMTATLDRRTWQVDRPDVGVLEYKTIAINKVAEWDKDASTIGCPIEYWIQVQHQMAVTGYQWGVLFGLAFNWNTIERRVERDQEFIDGMILKEIKFLDLLRTGTPPPMDSHKSTGRALKALHPDDNGETVTLTPEAVEAADELVDVEEQITALSKQRELHRNVIMACIGPNTTGMGPGFCYHYKTQERAGYVVKPGKSRKLRRSKA